MKIGIAAGCGDECRAIDCDIFISVEGCSVGPGATAELLVALDDIASIDHTVQLTVADMPNAPCICFVRPKARLLSSNAIR